VGKVNGLALYKIDVRFGSGGAALILGPGNVLVKKGIFVSFLGTLDLVCLKAALGFVLEGTVDCQQ